MGVDKADSLKDYWLSSLRGREERKTWLGIREKEAEVGRRRGGGGCEEKEGVFAASAPVNR